MEVGGVEDGGHDVGVMFGGVEIEWFDIAVFEGRIRIGSKIYVEV